MLLRREIRALLEDTRLKVEVNGFSINGKFIDDKPFTKFATMCAVTEFRNIKPNALLDLYIYKSTVGKTLYVDNDVIYIDEDRFMPFVVGMTIAGFDIISNCKYKVDDEGNIDIRSSKAKKFVKYITYGLISNLMKNGYTHIISNKAGMYIVGNCKDAIKIIGRHDESFHMVDLLHFPEDRILKVKTNDVFYNTLYNLFMYGYQFVYKDGDEVYAEGVLWDSKKVSNIGLPDGYYIKLDDNISEDGCYENNFKFKRA